MHNALHMCSHRFAIIKQDFDRVNRYTGKTVNLFQSVKEIGALLDIEISDESCYHGVMLTMADVAKRAGVGRSTVSHVLGGHRDVNVRIPESTRQRVLDAAHELGYRPNELARSVRSGKSRMIGYLVNDPHYEPYWKTIIGALAEAEQEGFTLKLLSVTADTLNERVRQCIELRLCGLIVRVSEDKSSLYDEAIRAQIPVVTVDESIPQPFGVRVGTDDALGCQAAISHLVGLGHSRIGFIASGFSNRPLVNKTGREVLFRAEMATRNLSLPEGFVCRENMMVYGPKAEPTLDTSSVVAATEALLDHPRGRPTAIFCWRDETALSAIHTCCRRGLRVPDDISIVGFSDITAARLSDPPLTTCTSPWEEMGRRALRELLCPASGDFDPSPRAVLVPSGLVVRGSSGPVPAAV